MVCRLRDGSWLRRAGGVQLGRSTSPATDVGQRLHLPRLTRRLKLRDPVSLLDLGRRSRGYRRLCGHPASGADNALLASRIDDPYRWHPGRFAGVSLADPERRPRRQVDRAPVSQCRLPRRRSGPDLSRRDLDLLSAGAPTPGHACCEGVNMFGLVGDRHSDAERQQLGRPHAHAGRTVVSGASENRPRSGRRRAGGPPPPRRATGRGAEPAVGRNRSSASRARVRPCRFVSPLVSINDVPISVPNDQGPRPGRRSQARGKRTTLPVALPARKRGHGS